MREELRRNADGGTRRKVLFFRIFERMEKVMT